MSSGASVGYAWNTEKISQMWGKPENFEEFVRTELVDIFAESKRRYAHQIRRIALSALETTFGG